jgi:ATP-dependent Lon protease
MVVLPEANAADVEALRESVADLPPVVLVERVEQALAVVLGSQEGAPCTE